jgi:hypothetical protein
MAKLEKIIKPPHITENYIRVRVRPPESFIKGSIRTHDIGRKGYSKRLAGRTKKTGKWATQAFLIARNEPLATKKKILAELGFDKNETSYFAKYIGKKKSAGTQITMPGGWSRDD